MKKGFLILFAILSCGLIQNTTAACLSHCSDRLIPEIYQCDRFSLFLSGLYCQVTNSDSDFAILNGVEHDIDASYDWGLKAEIAYQFACTANDVKLAITNFNPSDSASVSGDVIATRGNLINNSPFVSVSPGDISVSGFFTNFGVTAGPVFTMIPGAQLGTFSVPITPNAISIKQDFKNQVWDLAIGSNVSVGNRLHFHLFTGTRYLQLEKKLETKILASGSGTAVLSDVVLQGVSVDPSIGGNFLVLLANPTFEFSVDVNDTINQRSKYSGFGPLFGVDASLQIFGNLSLISNITTSLLIGESKNSYNEIREDNSLATFDHPTLFVFFPGFDLIPFDITQISPTSFTNTTSQRIHVSSPDETRIVRNIDAKVGLQYSYLISNNGKRAAIEAGYQISHFFNAVAEFNMQQPSNGIHYESDTNFNGFYVGIQLVI